MRRTIALKYVQTIRSLCYARYVARDSIDRNLIISNILVRDDRALSNVAT